MSDSIRIRTTPNGSDTYLKVKVEQKFDFIEILSLKISQDKTYESFCSDYGVIVGRVVVNNGFGVPNVKVSVFIPITDEDKGNPDIFGIYPYETVNDKNSDGVRYNLLPKESDNQNVCYTPVGTFPTKREILDNEDMLGVYCKYYKFTTTTNSAGDYMLFGVPVGNHVVHIDADISNIGIVSQRPYDLIDQGTPAKYFYSPTKFKDSKNLNSLVQIKTFNSSVNVKPFWGDINICEIGINRLDFDLNHTIRPSAIFVGSIFGDSGKNSVNKQCRPRKNTGNMCEQVTGEGSIEMIRKTLDNQIERFDVEGGRVIDNNGSWAYQIPMNLDYVVTDEFGNLVPSEDTTKGIPTRARVRFRVGMDEDGNIGRIRTRAKYLIPHNPKNVSELDFNFDSKTKDENFVDLYWNKIYTIKNFISRSEKRIAGKNTKAHLGIKNVDGCVGDKNPFPYNRAQTSSNPLFTIICVIVNIITIIISGLNSVICALKNLCFLGICPFGFLKPIGIPCPNDEQTIFTPGCGNTNAQYTKCFSSALAEQLNLGQLDFYNDWVNGTLYYYLLKYKKKRRGNEKFCDSDKDYNTNQLTDTTVNSNNDNYGHTFKKGLLAKRNGVLYYLPILLDGSNMKLYATDIVNLGAVLDCDWQGLPKIVDYLVSTSYKLPPINDEAEDDNSTVSGMIQGSASGTGLFFDINCSGLDINPNQATNIRRLSEIGVDLPESENGSSPHRTVTINEIYDRSDPIDVVTSPNRYIRDTFYLLNVNGSEITSYPSIDPTPLNIPTLGTSFAYDGNISVESHKNGSAYNSFREYHSVFNSSRPDMAFQAWGNSYFMYFGIVPGKTGLDKLRNNYFTNCDQTLSNDFIIESDVINTISGNDGVIKFTMIGGTAPFKYIVIGTNYSNGPSTTTNNVVLTGLAAGTYKITVTDELETTMIKDVIVS